MGKTNDNYFVDWEGAVFGFGYGSGEEHTIPALKTFLAEVNDQGAYDYEVLEGACGGGVAWLLINALCRADILEYGSSPRFGWLTKEGHALKAYVDGHKTNHMRKLLACDESYVACRPDHCNCDDGPCDNPFWVTAKKQAIEAAAGIG